MTLEELMPLIPAITKRCKRVKGRAGTLSAWNHIAGGKYLDFLNVFLNDTNVPGDFGKVDLAYKAPDTGSIGIVDVRSGTEVVVLSTGDAQITFSGIRGSGIVSVESGSFYGSKWIKSSSASYKTSGDDMLIQVDAYQCVIVVTKKSTK